MRTQLSNADDWDADLIQKCFNFNPYLRITARDALTHPCFFSNQETSSTLLLDGFIDQEGMAPAAMDNSSASLHSTPEISRVADRPPPVVTVMKKQFVSAEASQLMNIGLTVTSMNIIHQYLFLRELELDEVYSSPYFSSRKSGG